MLTTSVALLALLQTPAQAAAIRTWGINIDYNDGAISLSQKRFFGPIRIGNNYGAISITVCGLATSIWIGYNDGAISVEVYGWLGRTHIGNNYGAISIGQHSIYSCPL